MRRRTSLILGLMLFQVSCQSPNDDCCDGPKEVTIGEPFSITEGESVDVESSIIELTFSELLDDTLCPSDVECVTQGTLTISVHINGTNRTLSIGDNQNSITAYKDYTIELERLVYPTKQAEKDNGNSTYAVQMLISRP